MLLLMALVSHCGRGTERSGVSVTPFDEVFRLERRFPLRDSSEAQIGYLADLVPWNARLVVVDGQQARLLMFDSTGRLLGTSGRPGDGPGEFRMPGSATVVSDGRLAVLDLRRLYVSFFRAGGTYDTGWSVAEFFPGAMVSTDGGKLVIAVQSVSADTGVNAPPRTNLQVYDLAGRRLQSFAPVLQATHINEANFATLAVAAMESVTVWVPASSNRVHHRNQRSGREWVSDVGASVYTPPAWPKRPLPIPQIPAWQRQQMWVWRMLTLDPRHYIVQVTLPDSGGTTRYQYVVVADDGRTTATTTPTSVYLRRVHGGVVYGTTHGPNGEVEVGVYRYGVSGTPSPQH
jgi:hypothetical protein